MFVIASKIFSILLGAITIAKSYVDFRSRLESLQMFLFWTLTWTLIIIVALFPTLVDLLLNAFGPERAGLGTFFGMAIVFLFFVVYRIYVKIERMEKKLTRTIQELALRDDWTVRR
jgi:small membrane protein